MMLDINDIKTGDLVLYRYTESLFVGRRHRWVPTVIEEFHTFKDELFLDDTSNANTAFYLGAFASIVDENGNVYLKRIQTTCQIKYFNSLIRSFDEFAHLERENE